MCSSRTEKEKKKNKTKLTSLPYGAILGACEPKQGSLYGILIGVHIVDNSGSKFFSLFFCGGAGIMYDVLT